MSIKPDLSRPDASSAEVELTDEQAERIVEIVEASLRRRARAELAATRGHS